MDSQMDRKMDIQADRQCIRNTPTTGLTTVLNEQPPFVQPGWTNSHCSFNRLSNRVVQQVWQLAVYTIQPVVKPVVKRVWQPV